MSHKKQQESKISDGLRVSAALETIHRTSGPSTRRPEHARSSMLKRSALLGWPGSWIVQSHPGPNLRGPCSLAVSTAHRRRPHGLADSVPNSQHVHQGSNACQQRARHPGHRPHPHRPERVCQRPLLQWHHCTPARAAVDCRPPALLPVFVARREHNRANRLCTTDSTAHPAACITVHQHPLPPNPKLQTPTPIPRPALPRAAPPSPKHRTCVQSGASFPLPPPLTHEHTSAPTSPQSRLPPRRRRQRPPRPRLRTHPRPPGQATRIAVCFCCF